MSDLLLARYAALARRAQALLETPVPEATPDAPAAVEQLVSDAIYRLGLYVTAMPGARGAPAPEDVAALARTAGLAVDPGHGGDSAIGDADVTGVTGVTG